MTEKIKFILSAMLFLALLAACMRQRKEMPDSECFRTDLLMKTTPVNQNEHSRCMVFA
ncbi:hypothetical protein [Prevotella koreensis]|uniref:hypothetical protein n=1 Tax=Prevotella koreensis TaxID=2490854 RepID=UPI001319F1F9|nr:hypothetical protein [Prevotella koreensis]